MAAAAIAAVTAAATVALDVRGAHVRIPASAQLEPGWPTTLAGLAQLVPGVLLLHRLPRHPVAWVMTGFGMLWMLDALASSWAVHAVYVSPGAPGASAAYWFYARFGASLMLALPVLILLFPDGRLPAARLWRGLSLASLALTGLLTLLLVTAPAAVLVRFHAAALPPEIARLDLDPFVVALPYAFWEPALRIAYVGALVSLVVPFAVTVHRYRAAGRERRAQIRWLMWAALVDMLVLLLPFRVPPQLPTLLFGLSIAVTSAAVLVAVTKYRLYDVDRLLSATVTYALLAGMVVLVDVAVFTAAGRVLGERDSALTAIAIVAVLYAPLRTRLARVVRRLVRGTRDDPYAAVSTLAERLELAADPDRQLLAVAATLTEAFRLSYIRVEIEQPGGSRSVVEHGSPRGPSVTLPVAYRGEVVGRLLLCRTDLTERDQRLLGDLVRQAAAAARASELSTDLQRIRARLVVAREEERRRLRRDLHDGLGPSLGAVALRIEAARNLAATAPDRADRILAQTAADVGGVLNDVRRLVHDLRPPALDELGLLRAIEQQADRFRSPALDVVVGGEGALERLPAAVEVAAYRIVSEALANVARHSGAARCEITLAARDGSLDVTVRDDGSGIRPDVTAGVGMLSLRERAIELGGDCEVGCPPEGGTLVRARLPAGRAMEVADV
ncbi:sensor histidine kinase [Planomonospora sp. ID67723]|uniref:sensor histidine kinase n=1 Tax=Planomonospora sp. ID67723 TaxID=2738134 RepID=UPI0018C41413|nr:sensor histidine kinase [Planomonospora sp. ID67723]MBG0827506.1 sensor histidine kinase [Planomonospora sp. ID67723]